MLVYSGKAKGLTFKALLWIVFLKMSVPVEALEASDFSEN